MNFNILFVSLLLYSFSIAFKKVVVVYDILPLLIMFLVSLKNLRIKNLFLAWIKLNGFVLLIVGMIFLFHRDYYMGFLIAWRVNLILLFNLMIVYSHTPNEIFSGLVHLKIPWKLKAIFLFSFKYLDIFLMEKDKIFETLKARNFKSKTNLFTYRTIAFIVGSLFYKGFLKADILKEALIVRCFNGKFYTLSDTKIGIKEFGVLIIVFICFMNNLLRFYL